MSKKKSNNAQKPNSTIKIGDRTVAETIWDGNNYITQYKPTNGESQVMSALQASIPTAYQEALNGGNAEQYAQNWYDNQVQGLNESMNPQLTALKDNLITGGQVGSNIGWNKINALSDSYTDSLTDLYTNKEALAQEYRNNLLGWANSLQNAMNGYYNIGSQMAGNASSNQQNAANQNLNYTQYNNALNSSANQSNANFWGSIGNLAGTAIGSAFGSPLSTAIGSNLGSIIASGLSRRSG